MSIELENKSDYHSHFKGVFARLASEISWHVRKKMFNEFMKEFGDAHTILDVGATSEGAAKEANYFEELYPHKDRITAVGIEDASLLEKKYPGIKFIKIEPNKPLPFEDQSFDVVFSNAVIEHIVNENDRDFFVSELRRIGRAVFITTPNKWFPVEFHTGVPFVHWFTPLFNWLLDAVKVSSFYSTKNLKLLSSSDLDRYSSKVHEHAKVIKINLLGINSNLIWIYKKNKNIIGK